jgi:hypothetical protein
VVALDALTDRARELALGVSQVAGPFDVEPTWLAFLTSGKPRSDGAWQAWCVRAAAFARRDRERERSRPTGPYAVRGPAPIAAPAEFGAKEMRQRKAEEKQAVPPPANLLDFPILTGGKRT